MTQSLGRLARLLCGTGALLLSLLPIAATAAGNTANTDMIVFGNVDSESAHKLSTGFGPVAATIAPIPSEPSAGVSSVLVTGALGQTARRLLPRTPDGDYYGGEATFTMAVDPRQENNLSLKMWGDDAQPLSWLVLDVDGLEVGARHLLKDESILQDSSGWLPGRFIYRTVRLPKALTAGKTTVTVKLRSLGRIAFYTNPYDNYQKRMIAPTVALYRAYTHVGAQPNLTDELLGQAPQLTALGSANATDEAAWLTAWKAQTNKMLSSRLSGAAATLTADDIDFLAQAYGVSWTTAHANAAVPAQVLSAMDAMVSAYSAAPTTYFSQLFPDHGNNGGWGGYLGQAGRGVTLLWPQLQGSFDVAMNYGGTLGQTTRRAGWAAALRASVDFGRTQRKTIGNQVMDTAQRIYWANAALLLIDSGKALQENEARRYLHEAYGLAPWMGDDQPGEGPVPVQGKAPYGPNWFMVTSRGTTKEDCLVGGDYGEMGAQALLLGRQIQDTALIQQGVKMLRARAGLRYPAADDAGKLVSVAAEPIGCRNDNEINGHKIYLANGAETVRAAAIGADTIGADLIGYAQQQFNEGQLLSQMPVSGGSWMKGYAGWNAIASVPDAYLAFRAQPATGLTLPMSIGQVDYAWGDEDNMAVVARHGEERFFANLYWRGAGGINRLARVFVIKPTMAHLAEVSVDDVVFRPSGTTITLGRQVDLTPYPGNMTPPDNPTNANAGLVLPQALRPDLSAIPATNRDAGRATAYTLRYGNWLIAINAHPTDSYAVKLPGNFDSGKELVSGAWKRGPLVLAPKHTAVFFLPDVKLLASPPPAIAVSCAKQGGQCALPTGGTFTVWYGANGGWFSQPGLRGNVACDNATFGDPLPGIVAKACFYGN